MVERPDLDAVYVGPGCDAFSDVLLGGLPFGNGANGDDQFGSAEPVEVAGCLKTEAGIRAGHDDGLPDEEVVG